MVFNAKNPRNGNFIDNVTQALLKWKKKGAKIVTTRHNKLPHVRFKHDKKLYELFYHYSDGMVHLGEYSRKEFLENHKEEYLSLKHEIICHPIYKDSYPEISKAEARLRLGLGKEEKVFLAFGKIRLKKEQELIIDVFKNIKKKNYTLLIPKILFSDKPSFRLETIKRLKYHLKFISWNLRKIYLNSFYNIKIDHKFYSLEEVCIFFKAADVVIIPRVEILNSGNIFQAITHNRPIICPSTGNLTEIIKETKNYLYTPNNSSSLMEAVSKTDIETGIKDYTEIKKKISIDEIASQYYSFYQKLIA
ncbi:MAG: hypothetical protein ACPG5P_02490 [Saprospiraceae bacterium]